MKTYKILSLIITMLTFPRSTWAQIQGFVLNERMSYNSNSTLSGGGIQGIKILLLGDKNELVAETYSDKSGKFSFNISDKITYQVRCSFDTLVWTPTSSICSFVKAPNQNVNFSLRSLNDILDYKGYFTAVYINGKPIEDSTAYNKNGIVFIPKVSNENDMKVIAPISKVGSVWALSYNQRNHKLYAGAFLKRFVGLGNIGLGGIYEVDIQNQKINPFLDLKLLGIPLGNEPSRDLKSDIHSGSSDEQTYGLIGKTGLGGLDWNNDGTVLGVVNLYDRNLYIISFNEDYSVKSIQKSKIKEIVDNEEVRPFAVKFYNGKFYVGAVLTAEKSKDNQLLKGYLFQIDVFTGESQRVMEVPLNYERGKDGNSFSLNWTAWSDDFPYDKLIHSTSLIYNPQPIISDIEFDHDGNAIIAIMDRFGHQIGTGQPTPNGSFNVIGVSVGDYIKASKKSTHKFTPESSISSTGTPKNNARTSQFFSEDNFKAEGVIVHQKSGLGALAFNTRDNTLIIGVHEPVTNSYNNSGTKEIDVENGKSLQNIALFKDSSPGTFSKSNALGDIEGIEELVSTAFIGNVWKDIDNDGLRTNQDTGIANIPVELWVKNNKIGQIKTTDNGVFIFPSLNPNTAYEAKINKEIIGKATLLKSGDAFSDNDAVEAGNYISVPFVTSSTGKNIFSYDFGIKCNQIPKSNVRILCNNISSEESKDKLVSLKWNTSNVNESFQIFRKNDFLTPIHDGYVLSNEIFFNASVNQDKEQNITIRLKSEEGCLKDTLINLSNACLTQDNKENLKISVYPNPTNQFINYEYQGNSVSSSVTMNVTTISGQLIKQIELSSKNTYFTGTLDLKDFASGIYIISIRDKDQLYSKKITKL